MTGRELLAAMFEEPSVSSTSPDRAERLAATPSGAELIRRADAEPVLRAALRRLPGRVWSHTYREFRRAGVDDADAIARADLVRIETERSIAALTTTD